MSTFKLKNFTTWSSRDLCKLFTLICKHEGYFPNIIEVVNARKQVKNWAIISGIAVVDGSWVRMRLPNKVQVIEYVSGSDGKLRAIIPPIGIYQKLYKDVIKKIAQIFIHELGHNLGLMHREMIDYKKINVDYVKGIIIHRRGAEK